MGQAGARVNAISPGIITPLVRINVDRVPTHEELVEAARRDGLSLIYLKVGGTVR